MPNRSFNVVIVFCMLCRNIIVGFRATSSMNSFRNNDNKLYQMQDEQSVEQQPLYLDQEEQVTLEWDPQSAPKLNFKENYYRLLEVDSNSADKDIKRAYKKLVFRYHPDRFPGDDDIKSLSEKQMMVINAAYKVLKDPEERLKYDKKFPEPIRVSSLSSPGGFGKAKQPWEEEQIAKAKVKREAEQQAKKDAKKAQKAN